MIVYGDPEFSQSGSKLAERVRSALSRTSQHSIDTLRALLIQIGQIEQAVQDLDRTSAEAALGISSQTATDYAAAAFYDACAARMMGELPASPWRDNEWLSQLLAELPILEARLHRSMLRIKVPEGFEFYALYPEQYAVAAARWAGQVHRAGRKRAVVIGIRSIGTTLSALVTATLRASGWQVERFTVRPHGHPYRRKADLPALQLQAAEWALVVDEGPGISGSSMAAVITALEERGFPSERICLLPGHAGDPGAAASTEVQQCWKRVQRLFVPLGEIHWSQQTLIQRLTAASEALGVAAGQSQVEDLSGGIWRNVVFDRKHVWPAILPSLERAKYRWLAVSGEAILWKFAGLGAFTGLNRSIEDRFEQMSALAREDWTPAPIGCVGGFTGWEWQQGTPLRASDAGDPTVLDRLANYIARCAQRQAPAIDSCNSFLRLSEMLKWNTKEALGERVADLVCQFAASLAPFEVLCASADGRMQPHEWLRRQDGQIIKTDSLDHEIDHTIVGEQPFLWDVAGVLIEWQPSPAAANYFLGRIRSPGLQFDSAALRFYELAYAAFRMGLMKLASETLREDREEAERCHRAFERYRTQFSELLERTSAMLGAPKT